MDKERSFHNSIINNNFSKFIELLDNEKNTNFIGNILYPYCLLCLTCLHNRKEMVEELLRRGINPNGNCRKIGDSHCSIRNAIGYKRIEIIKLLISNGVDYDYSVTRDQITAWKSPYNQNDKITLQSDLKKFNIDEKEIDFFIRSLNRKVAVRE